MSTIEAQAEALAEDADLDVEPEENFDELTNALEKIEALFENDGSIEEPLAEARSVVTATIAKVAERRASKLEEDDEWNWEDQLPSESRGVPLQNSNPPSLVKRSIFSDVNE